MRHYFVKHGSPVWIHIPGTPFTLPGIPANFQRLAHDKTAQDRGLKLDRPYEENNGAATQGLLAEVLERREESANDSKRGLLAEQILPQPSKALQELPNETATAPTPLVTMMSNTGA